MSSTAAHFSAPALPRLQRAEISIFSQAGIFVFLLGVASGIPIQTVGRLFVGEVLLTAIAPLVALLLFGLTDWYGRTVRLILLALIISWLGYVGSDFYRGTDMHDYLRGWARWIAMGASFATLAWLGSKDMRYVIIFLVGLAIGTAMTPLIYGGFLGVKGYWKFYGSMAACIVPLFMLSRYSPWVSVLTLMGLAVTSVILDDRAVALVCMAAAGVSALAARRSARPWAALTPPSKTSIAVAMVVVAVMLLGTVKMISYLGEKYGHTERYAGSNASRRSNAEVAWTAIRNSPFIGYGSWPRDPELALLRDKLVKKYKGAPILRSAEQQDLIIVHSQILQGWVEGGLLGFFFFALLGWQLARSLLWLAFSGPYFNWTPIAAFAQLLCAFNLIFSPFSGAQRVLIPAACVLLCYTAAQGRELNLQRRAVMAGYMPPGYWPAQ